MVCWLETRSCDGVLVNGSSTEGIGLWPDDGWPLLKRTTLYILMVEKRWLVVRDDARRHCLFAVIRKFCHTFETTSINSSTTYKSDFIVSDLVTLS